MKIRILDDTVGDLRLLKKGLVEEVTEQTARILIGYKKAELYVEASAKELEKEIVELIEPEIEKEKENVRSKHRK